MFVFIKEILVNIFGESLGSSLWVAPLAINFTITFLWMILKNIFRTSSKYEAAIETIFHLFSFLVTFFILLSINFYLDLNELPQASYSLWLPSAASISLGEIARMFTSLRKVKEETSLDRKQRQLSWYFILTIIILSFFWVYMVFTEELEPVFWILSFLDKFLL